MRSSTCLIIGAGMCGLTAAAELQRRGWDVTVIDKGHVPGGRMATRKVGEGVFDYGAQFFTVRAPEFRDHVQLWENSKLVRVWTNGFATPNGSYKPDGHPRYCGVDGMNSVPRQMAAQLVQQGVGLDCSARAENLRWTGNRWHAGTIDKSYTCDVLILTAPVPQSLELLERSSIDVPSDQRRLLATAKFEKCLSILLQTDRPALVPDPGAIIDTDGQRPIAFLSDNSRKGISPVAGSLTVHSSWSKAEDLWDEPDVEIIQQFTAFSESLIRRFTVTDAYVHRWKYSKPVQAFDSRAISCRCPGPIVFAGDIFAGSRVEGAFLSGLEAARQASAAI